MKNNQELNAPLLEIHKAYCKFYNMEHVNVNFVIAIDMFEEYKKLRPDHIQNGRINIKEINIYNGLTIPPFDNQNFTILISYSYLQEQIQQDKIDWIGTIAHELTHVYDFLQYKVISGYEYDEMLDYSKNRMFDYWTEFNAKVKGYLFLRKFTFADLYDRTQVEYIKTTELPFLAQYMVNECGKTKNADRQLYVVSHFLAHIYVWHELFPLDFKDDFLNNIFGENEWMNKLYVYYSKNRDLKKAYLTFDEMKEILRTNFSGI